LRQELSSSASQRAAFETNLAFLSATLLKSNESLAILFSEVFDTSPLEFSLDAVLSSDSAQVGNTFRALRKLLSVNAKERNTLGKSEEEGEDFEMFDETQNKNGSQAQ